MDSDKALEYSRRAGERALENLAPDEAVRWFSQALELQSQQQDPDRAERCDILIGLGEAQKQTGDSDFRQTLLDASALAEELGDGDRLARAAMTNNRGFMSAAGITDEDVISKLESAIKLAGESQLERRATLLSLLSLELIWAGDLERRLGLAEQALELARESGDERSVAFVLWRRFNPTALPETLEQRTADMAEMREIADRLGDPYLRFFAALYSSTEAFERGDRALLDSEVDTLREIADELGQPVPRWSARWIEAVKALLAGHLERAEELVEEAAQVGATAASRMRSPSTRGSCNRSAGPRTARTSWRTSSSRGSRTTPTSRPIGRSSPGPTATWTEPTTRGRSSTRSRPAASRRYRRRCCGCPRWSSGPRSPRRLATSRPPPSCTSCSSPGLTSSPACRSPPGCRRPTTSGSWPPPLDGTRRRMRHFARALELEEGLDAPLFAAATRLAWGHALLEKDAADGDGQARELLEGALAAGRELGITRVERRAEALLAGATRSGWKASTAADPAPRRGRALRAP